MSSRAKIFLAVSALLWLPYGLYCLFVPSLLAASTWTRRPRRASSSARSWPVGP